MKEPISTKDKNILDKILTITKYIKTIYMCKLIIKLLQYFE